MIKILNVYKNLKRIKTSLKTNGMKSTLDKIKLHLKYKKQSPVFNLISLSPIKKPWISKKNLINEYDLSVIIPTYNRADMLSEIIESWEKVDKVTKYSYEIIFSDDGSDDNSIEILEQVKTLPLKIIKNKHGGASKARNSAIIAARGKKLLIIGDDIFPNEQILNQHIEKLDNLSITDAVLGECIWHPDLKVNHLMQHITELGCEQFSFKYFAKNTYTDFRHFYTCNISIDREFLLSEKIIFDETFYKYGFEDIELGYRLAKKGMKIYYYPKAFGEHYHPYHDVRKFCNRQESAGEMAQVFKKLHEDIEPIVDINNIESKWMKYQPEASDNYSLSESIYDELILFCKYVEDNFITKDSKFSKELSIIYTSLFRFAYEKGVYQVKQHPIISHQNEIYRNEFFSQKLNKSLMKINISCKVPNYNKIMLLTDSAAKKDLLLTIEACNLEHLNELISRYKILQDSIKFRLKSEIPVVGFVYKPEKDFFIHINNMKQILLFIQHNQNIDFIFLSVGLSDFPEVGLAGSLSNSCIYLQQNTFEQNIINVENIFRGKIVRIFEDIEIQNVSFDSCLNTKLNNIDSYGYFYKKSFDILENKSIFLPKERENNKPVIFVFPIFLAVGGVERNTIEIMKQLKEKYDFVTITFERLQKSHGSLHHQFLDESIGLYDLTELSSHDMILIYLDTLNMTYNPELIWICNGSPWLAENTQNIRILFKDIAIVDQQVYDTDAGWVQLYKNRDIGLLSFDRFIAINSRIKDVFIKEVQIDEKNIDLIYSVMSSEKRVLALESKKEMLYKKFKLDKSQKYIVFIGRLVEQKAPMDLLKLINSIISKYGTEYKFVIVGSGELNCKITKYIKSNNLSDYIIKLDYVENTFELSIISDAIIFTSLFEGLSIALLEALSVGTPSISTDVGDTKLICEGYGNGIIFKTICNNDEYLETFNEFVKNYDFYKSNAEKYKNEIAERFSAKHISLQYIKCFENAVVQKNGVL